MKYYFIAGERSGDLHGGNLIKAINNYDVETSFRGFGGDVMVKEGMHLVRHYQDLAFMGFWEVLINLNKISSYLKQVKADILNYHPDVVILIDYGGFNLKVASFLKKHNIRCFYYITPKVWAWNQSRANKIKRLVDRMFVILPFEKEFYRRFNWEVDYVGNPVLDAVLGHNFEQVEISNNDRPIVAVLPGSRLQEVQSVLKTIRQVIENSPDTYFVVAKVDNLAISIYDEIDNLPNVELVEGDTYNLLKYAKAAIVTSGTATLETALIKVPQVIVYRTSFLSYLIGRAVIKVSFISLVNLIAGREVVKELIQADFNPDNLQRELNELLNNETYRSKILEDYTHIQNELNIGSASDNTAKLVVEYLKENEV